MFSYSTDEEEYWNSYETVEDACVAAVNEVEDGQSFWVGEQAEPPKAEDRWNAEDWLEDVDCQDKFSGDWADGWDESTGAQREELEREVRAVMAAWIERHKLRPKFWLIENPQKFFRRGDGWESAKKGT